MNKRARVHRSRFIGYTIILALCLGACSSYRPDRALRVATGTAAHDLCSEAFVAGLDPDRTFTESLAPRPGFRWIAGAVSYAVDREHREVRATFAGVLASRAVFREGLGCTLVHGDEPIDSPSLARMPHANALLPPIAGPTVVAPSDPRLVAALDAEFAEAERPPQPWTKAVVIVHEGRIIAERYAPGYGIDTPQLGFSMTKSVISALVGILVRDGKLAVHDPAPVAAWKGASDPRRAITLEQLMRMISGLDLDETGSGFDPSNLMFYAEPDMAAYAERASLKALPGTRWSYSSASTHILARIVRDAVGGNAEAVQRFAFKELFDPLGMRDVTLEMDATGTPVGGHYMLASARDWARLGCLYLEEGVVGGHRILPEGWIRFSATPTLDTDYGAGWWTNQGESARARERIKLGIPADAYFALGNLGQRIAVLPSQRLVVVRLGRSHRPGFDIEGFARLVTASVAAVEPTHHAPEGPGH